MADVASGGFLSLLLSSFLSATLLPGSSEAVLIWLVSDTGHIWLPVIVATMGNTLGGMTTYGLGRIVQWKSDTESKAHKKAKYLIHRWGSLTLLLSWVPIIGDAFCLAAGWIRVNWLLALCFMLLGKFCRYYVIAILID